LQHEYGLVTKLIMMKAKKQEELIVKGIKLFTSIFMKYDIMEKKPIDIGNGVKLHSSLIHTIEAIGKGYGKTVTELSIHFMITKGAVSQVIAILEKDGYILKTKGNNKKIILELSEKGRSVFECHEKYNESAMKELISMKDKYTEMELQSFLNILNDIDLFFGKFITVEMKI